MKVSLSHTIPYLWSILILLSCASCSSYNLIQSDKNAPAESADAIPLSDRYNKAAPIGYAATSDIVSLQSDVPEYIIRTADKLSMSIWGHPDLSVGTVFDSRASTNTTDRFIIVPPEGVALFPKIGAVKVAGLSTSELENELTQQYAEYIVDPQIIVRVENLYMTILGAVNAPGNHPLTNSSNTLAEVLGMSGGMQKYANTEALKLVRNDEVFILDLTQNEPGLLSELSIYAGDVIYIPYNKSKNLSDRSPGIIAVSSIISTAVLIISIFNN